MSRYQPLLNSSTPAFSGPVYRGDGRQLMGLDADIERKVIGSDDLGLLQDFFLSLSLILP